MRLQCHVPVSYTHLDVYKRQDQGDSPIIPYIKRYVSENLASASLNKISLELNLTPNYLSKLFREQMDITFTEYLIQEKMNYACQLLQNVNFKVYEVSLMCGRCV